MTDPIADAVLLLQGWRGEVADQLARIDAALAVLQAMPVSTFEIPTPADARTEFAAAVANGEATDPRNPAPATPRAPEPAAPGGRGRRTDDEVRALWADYDPATPLFTYLTVKGVPKGSRDHIVKRARRLGVLPELGAREEQHNQGPTTNPLVDPDAPAPRRPPYTDQQVRALWEALDPDIDVRSQLDEAGVPRRDHGFIRTLARHLSAQMLGGQLTEHPTWKSANGPLKGPALSKEPARPVAALVVGCTSCPFTADNAVDMQRHCLAEHRRAATGAERTPMTAAEAETRGVAGQLSEEPDERRRRGLLLAAPTVT